MLHVASVSSDNEETEKRSNLNMTGKVSRKGLCLLFVLSLSLCIFWSFEGIRDPILLHVNGGQFLNRSKISAVKWMPGDSSVKTGAGPHLTKLSVKEKSLNSSSIRNNYFHLQSSTNYSNPEPLISKWKDIRTGKIKDRQYTNRFSNSENKNEDGLQKFNGVQLQSFNISNENLDLMKLEPFKFLPNYKNPCWKTDHIKRPIACLPYFYLIGAPKAGTTDVFERLKAHPDFAAPFQKEPHWLTRKRFDSSRSSINYYIHHYFGKPAYQIYKWKDRTKYHRRITGDCSASTMFDNYNWRSLPHRAGLQEPDHTSADYIHHINPQARIIVMLREPVNRLYSDFLFFTRNGTQSSFHHAVKQAITWFTQCREKRSLRACVYDKRATLRVEPMVWILRFCM